MESEGKMEDMNKEQEWLASSIKENTKLHHSKAITYLKEYMQVSPEEMLRLGENEGKRFTTRVVMFWQWLQKTKGFSASTSSSYVFGVSARAARD